MDTGQELDGPPFDDVMMNESGEPVGDTPEMLLERIDSFLGNEDLADNAVWGTNEANTNPGFDEALWLNPLLLPDVPAGEENAEHVELGYDERYDPLPEGFGLLRNAIAEPDNFQPATATGAHQDGVTAAAPAADDALQSSSSAPGSTEVVSAGATQPTRATRGSVRRVCAISDNFRPIAPNHPPQQQDTQPATQEMALSPPAYSIPAIDPLLFEASMGELLGPWDPNVNPQQQHIEPAMADTNFADLQPGSAAAPAMDEFDMDVFNSYVQAGAFEDCIPDDPALAGGVAYGQGESSSAAVNQGFQYEAVPMQQYGNTVPAEGPAPRNPSSSSDPNSGATARGHGTSNTGIAGEENPVRRQYLEQKVSEVTQALFSKEMLAFALAEYRKTQQASQQPTSSAQTASAVENDPPVSSKKAGKRPRNQVDKQENSVAKRTRSSQAAPATTNNGRPRDTLSSAYVSLVHQMRQFWRGRRDSTQVELPASFLCHGEAWTTARTTLSPRYMKSQAGRFDESPEEFPDLENEVPKNSENVEDLGAHNELMLYTETMDAEHTQRPVYPGQILVVSYDLNQDWWRKINIWAWNRYPTARCADEIFIVITGSYIIFARIPVSTVGVTLRDYRIVMGIIDRTFRTEVLSTKGPYWSYIYRLMPVLLSDPADVEARRPHMMSSRIQLVHNLGLETYYHRRIKHFIYCVPAFSDVRNTSKFSIRVANCGMKGQQARPHVEIVDLFGRKTLDWHEAPFTYLGPIDLAPSAGMSSLAQIQADLAAAEETEDGQTAVIQSEQGQQGPSVVNTMQSAPVQPMTTESGGTQSAPRPQPLSHNPAVTMP